MPSRGQDALNDRDGWRERERERESMQSVRLDDGKGGDCAWNLEICSVIKEHCGFFK